MKEYKYDIAVVGGGILGLAHAYHCLEKGLSVLIIERDRYPRHASVRNFGQIVPSGFGVKWQQYGIASLKIYEQLAKQANIYLRQEGSLYVASNDEEVRLLEELAEINRQNKYESILWTRAQCIEHCPSLQANYVMSGLYFPKEMVIDPTLGIPAIINVLHDVKGLHYLSNTLIVSCVKGSGGVELLSACGKKITAQKAFICNGTVFDVLYPEYFQESNLVNVNLQMMSTSTSNNLRIKGSILTGWSIRRYESFQECNSFHEIKSKESTESIQKEHGVHILFKQNADGSIIIGDSHHYFPVKGNVEPSYNTSQPLNDFMFAEAKKIMNLDQVQISKTWLGKYSQCDNEEIYLRTIGDDIHVVTGIGGKGMTASFGFAQHYLEGIL